MKKGLSADHLRALATPAEERTAGQERLAREADLKLRSRRPRDRAGHRRRGQKALRGAEEEAGGARSTCHRERPIRPNDLRATVLPALGIKQRQLYDMHNNHKELVPVNGGQVIEEVFA